MTVEQRPGTVLHLADADYRYGAGRLVLRVERVDVEDPVTVDGEVWYMVHGVQLGGHGAERGARSALVRDRLLPPSS
ncbi:hypothetical protein AB0M46_41200 [Dactylosporangium sp. NPDC051485]|uniref:hypothetical protein n=1 Tax=Dactylosporangium sp. NPDC051485 TaxID=3154846 RepID=UPI00344AF62E